MSEKKPVVGLSWQPQLPVPSLSKAANDSTDIKSQIEVSSRTLWKPNSELVDGLFVPPNDPRKLNKLLRQQAKDTAGRSWFDMPAQTITPELQKELKLLKLVLRKLASHTCALASKVMKRLKDEYRILLFSGDLLRDAIDPKRHYKKGDSKSKALPKYFQVGTVVESPLEFFSGRLTKKERKASLAEELLSDPSLAAYRKRKVREIEEKNRPGGNENWKIKGQSSWKRAKERRKY